MLRKIIFLSLASAACLCGFAKGSNVNDLKYSITDNHIVFPASYESDTQKLLEGWYMKNYTATDNKYRTSSDPGATDEQYMQRLAELPTVIDMPYNQIVRSYIERYTKKGRSGVAAILGLSNYYMPIFEQALEEAGLPLELKYLPVIESALNPNAVSRMGATGLWQFMLSAAKGYNMEVNSLVDERRDPYVSSRKAAAFLKDLYDTYGDWSLVIAAYNCGPGNVNKALRRAGEGKKDFWAIYPYLPSETRGYVPMFIAANYVMNYYPQHNISPVLPTKPLITDTVAVNSRVHFNQIAKVLDIPVDELRILNPQFRADVIPGTAKKPYMLILPSQQIHAYLLSEAEIKNYDADLYARRTVAEPGKGASAVATDEEADNAPAFPVEESPAELAENPADEALADEIAEMKQTAARNKSSRSTSSSGKNVYTHVVADGETIGDIAEMYGVTKSEIRVQNGLRREAVRVGQELRITTSRNVDVAQASAPRKQSSASSSSQTSTSVSSRSTQQAAPASKARNRSQQNEQTVSSRTAGKQQTANNDASTKKNNKAKQQQQQTAQTSTKKSKKAQQQEQQTAQTSSKKNKKGKNQQDDTAANSKKNNKNNKSNKAKQPEPKTREHNIKEGESLSKIADRYGVSVDDLKKANGMTNDKIRAGKTLNIPKKSKTSKADAKKDSKKDSKSSKKGKADSGKSNSKSSSKKGSKKR